MTRAHAEAAKNIKNAAEMLDIKGFKKENIKQLHAARCFPEGRKTLSHKSSASI
jgi:hypothetical protein